MNFIRRVTAVILSVILIAGCAFGEWQADIAKLMPENEAPDSATRNYSTGFGDSASSYVIACGITVNSKSYGCEFEFQYEGIKMDDWSVVQEWLGNIVTRASASAGSDARALVTDMDRQISEAISTAAATTNPPIWAGSQLKLKRISVSSPYYPQLSQGMRSGDVQKLQERLIVLGFLDDTADGYFGANTKTSVKALQTYVRMLENEVIDEYLANTVSPTKAPAATATPTLKPTIAPTKVPSATHELTLVPKETLYYNAMSNIPTPEPTEEPAATEMPMASDDERIQPQTAVTGVADASVQAFLYSWSFPIAHAEQAEGSKGEDAMRIQTRLNNLGYTSEVPDGEYGSATVSAVRMFQRTNGISETGVCDTATQKVLFSVNAIGPVNKAIGEGDSGEEVKRMQEQLRIYGFTNDKADGSYGSATRSSVEAFQRYINASTTTQVPVTGSADAVTLDMLYNDTSVVTPAAMQTGDKNGNVTRVQKRLIGLGFLKGTADGEYGKATATAVAWFQRQHHISETGIADAQTLSVLFSSNAGKALNAYEVKVSIADQRVYVYGLDDNNEYTVLVRTMICSTGKSGSDTPKGTYQATTGPGARWHYFTKFDCWAQYAYYIQGDIMFHSVLFKQKGGKVTQSSVNNLGRRASHGCVRLAVEDAEWIYRNCPKGTKVTIY